MGGPFREDDLDVGAGRISLLRPGAEHDIMILGRGSLQVEPMVLLFRLRLDRIRERGVGVFPSQLLSGQAGLVSVTEELFLSVHPV